jgi:hypothetical protein
LSVGFHPSGVAACEQTRVKYSKRQDPIDQWWIQGQSKAQTFFLFTNGTFFFFLTHNSNPQTFFKKWLDMSRFLVTLS